MVSIFTLRAMASKNVGANGLGTDKAGFTVLDNLSKILGPPLHTAVYVGYPVILPTAGLLRYRC